ncbi:MAG: carbohydrate deacetylase [Janthinobacterium lividum]
MSVRVIVHADDFGLHPSLNEGIELAHRDGIVTSASLMPLGSAFEDAVHRIKSLLHLDLGLHFTLVGVPGKPPTLRSFLSAYGRGQMPSRVLEAELRRQFEALNGLPISHLDSHQHLHALPSIMRVVCRFASQNGIRAIRLPIDGPPHISISRERRVQAAALAAMSRLSRHYLTAYNIQTSDYFSGMAVSGHLTAPVLASYLTNARDGLTEIVCHPGTDNAALSQVFDWGYDWQGELNALRSPEAFAALTDKTITLTNWRGV